MIQARASSGSRERNSQGLDLEHVAKFYGPRAVLHDMDLHVKEGELVCLLGPSGCGKTTTLNIVAGFLSPDSGRVMIGASDVTSLPPYRRDMAIVFQNYALFPHMTVRDNVSYGLRARRLARREIDARVQSVLRLLGIEEFARRYPSQLSGGQQQRVAVARAVVVRPSVLLMDEPLSNLDAKLRSEVRLELRRLQQELGQTVLFVTHDQDEAFAISDRIAILNEGVCEQIGTPKEIYDHPETVFVSDFVAVENLLAVRRQDGKAVAGQGIVLPRGREEWRDYVGIRPTAIQLSADGTAGDNCEGLTLTARVVGTTYLGGAMRYAIESERGDRLVAVVDEDAALYGVGDRVLATLPARRLLNLSGGK